MNESYEKHILPVLRGALLNHLSAVTLCVNEKTSGGEELDLRSDADGLDAGRVVASVSAWIERAGSAPRRIRLGDRTVAVVGTSLATGLARGEELLSGDRTPGAHPIAGRVAVVTGGAQGFGEQIVRALVECGARVFIADLNLDGARRLSDEVNGEHGPLTRGVQVDVSNEESVAALMDTVVREAGGFDLMVSNAGVLKAGSVKEMTGEDFDFVTRVNYRGLFLCAKHSARVMAVQNASAPHERFTDLIQINSKSGLSGSNRNGAYAGSKFGGIGLVQSFALELVADRIKVNAICPGNFFDGPLWSDPDRGLFVQYLKAGKVPGAQTIADVKAYYEAQVPMGRGCRGEDVVRALLYLVEQCYETGQAVPVTGGQIMLS